MRKKIFLIKKWQRKSFMVDVKTFCSVPVEERKKSLHKNFSSSGIDM
jgi:hypothetical protein